MDEHTSLTATDAEQSAEDMVREYVFKVVVIGDYNVGKTTLLKRLLTVPFHRSAASLIGSDEDIADIGGSSSSTVTEDVGDEDDLRVVPTVGVDFYARVLRRVRPNVNLRLQLWDTAGLEQYAAVQASTYRHASLLLAVYDVTRRASLQSLLHHHLATAAEHLPELAQNNIFVVGNKTDLRAPAETAALRRNDHRSRHPEAAFVDDTDTATDLASAATDGRRDDDRAVAAAASPPGTAGLAVTAPVAKRVRLAEQMVHESQVQELLLDDLPEVHYSEVSALRRSGVARLLESMVAYLLKTQVDTTVEDAPHPTTRPTTQTIGQDDEEAQARQSSRRQMTGTAGPDSVACSDDKRANASGDDVQFDVERQHANMGHPTVGSSSAVVPSSSPPLETGVVAGVGTSTGAKTAAGSWRNSGMNFDLVRSPHSPGATGAGAAPGLISNVSSPLYSPQEATHTATPRTDEQDACEALIGPHGPSRAAQERAELQQLLARRGRQEPPLTEAKASIISGQDKINSAAEDAHGLTDCAKTAVMTGDVQHVVDQPIDQDVAQPASDMGGQDEVGEDASTFRKRIQDRYTAIEKQRDDQQKARSGGPTNAPNGNSQIPPPPVNVAAQYKKQKQKCNCRCHS